MAVDMFLKLGDIKGESREQAPSPQTHYSLTKPNDGNDQAVG
ncbi:hypothetical protein SAMN04490186_5004 [Pseudomonas grimontii]|jgi:hypothetical protein|uniref:Uncharacterized protein n=1 Tax=Pseudomonas grimontii TaxID=129847 RepID=A0ABY0TS76_9PSED|nr:hypothetical protein [Pseudomonas grimontii]SDR31319.1 hypothetical protein SAMN04490186_5004 [Pseudomonas grimontii]